MYSLLHSSQVTRKFILTNFQSQLQNSSIDGTAIMYTSVAFQLQPKLKGPQYPFRSFRSILFLFPEVCFENILFCGIAYLYFFRVSSPRPQFYCKEVQFSKVIWQTTQCRHYSKNFSVLETSMTTMQEMLAAQAEPPMQMQLSFSRFSNNDLKFPFAVFLIQTGL